MPTFAKQCALLAELYALQDFKGFQESEEFQSYLSEYSLVLAIALAIQDEIVEANATSENLINVAFGDLAEMFGTDEESLGSYDSIRDVVNLDSWKES